MQVKKTRWSHYLCNYHIVWIPKYRRKVLVGEVAKETERFPHLKEEVHPRSLWVRSYYVGATGHVSQETIKRYIEEAQDL